MLSGTLGATLLENISAGKGVIRAGGGAFRAEQDFLCRCILSPILKFKKSFKMNLNLKEFIQETIHLK